MFNNITWCNYLRGKYLLIIFETIRLIRYGTLMCECVCGHPILYGRTAHTIRSAVELRVRFVNLRVYAKDYKVLSVSENMQYLKSLQRPVRLPASNYVL